MARVSNLLLLVWNEDCSAMNTLISLNAAWSVILPSKLLCPGSTLLAAIIVITLTAPFIDGPSPARYETWHFVSAIFNLYKDPTRYWHPIL